MRFLKFFVCGSNFNNSPSEEEKILPPIKRSPPFHSDLYLAKNPASLPFIEGQNRTISTRVTPTSNASNEVDSIVKKKVLG